MKRALALTIVLVCAAVPALAQDRSDSSPLCGMSSPTAWQELRERFVGDWRVAHLSGYVLAGGMVIPMQPSPETETMSIWLLGEDLLLDHPEMTEPMAVTLADEGRWVIEIDHPKIPEPVLTPDDAVLAWAGDCDQEDLPRLVGRGDVSMAGAVMDMTLRMLPVDMDTMSMTVESGPRIFAQKEPRFWVDGGHDGERPIRRSWSGLHSLIGRGSFAFGFSFESGS